MLTGISGILLAVSALAVGAAPLPQKHVAGQTAVQSSNAPTRQWAIGRWFLERDQCRGRSFLILNADGTYVLEEFDAGTWTLAGNVFRREPRRMFLGDGMTRPEPYGRIVPTSDRIDYVDARRMTYTVSSTGFVGRLTRCE